MTKLYTAYGLIIQSDIEILELLPISDSKLIDVKIREVNVLSEPLLNTNNEYTWTATADTFIHRIPDVADYLVSKGNYIEFTRSKDCKDREICVYLLGSIIAALLQQRGFLTLHASSIQTELGAVLFMGRSGSGKSTLLNALLQQGFKMMCDDVTAVNLNTQDQPMTTSGFPRSRLWSDSATKLAHQPEKLERVTADIEKYNIPVTDQFYNGECPIKHIFVLSSHNQEQILQVKQTPSESFAWLQQYTYRKRFVRGNALMKHQFEFINALSQQTPLTQITRPSHLFLLDELVELVINTVTT